MSFGKCFSYRLFVLLYSARVRKPTTTFNIDAGDLPTANGLRVDVNQPAGFRTRGDDSSVMEVMARVGWNLIGWR